MNNRLIRAAIALYPPDWRRRYGVEFEQTVTDAWDAASSRRLAKAWLIVEVAASGVHERLRDRGVGHKHRIAGAVATTVAATAALILFTGGSQVTAHTPPAAPMSPLAPNVHLSSDVMKVNDTSLHGAKGLQHILLEVDPASGMVVEAAGVPADIKLNTKTGQIAAVKPAAKR